MRKIRVIVAVLAGVWIWQPGCAAFARAATHASARSCDFGTAEPVEMAALSPEFDMQLKDGRVLKLAGLAPRFGEHDAGELDLQQKFIKNLAGKALFARILSPVPDRWGRFSAQAFVEDNDEPRLLAENILTEGLARFHPDPETAPCHAALLEAENAARVASSGLWDNGILTVYPAEAPETVAGKGGKFIIIEGKVWHTGVGRTRAFIDFGPRRGVDFTATILKKKLKAFARGGISIDALRGHVVRLRGTLDARFGPRLELTTPDALEVVD